MNKIEVLILAGGRGTRLHEVIPDRPKPMAPIMQKPFLEYLILSAKAEGFRNFRILTGYKSEIIRDYFQDGQRFGVSIQYSHEEAPLGTAGAVKLGMQNSEMSHFLCFNGDSYFGMDLKSFQEQSAVLLEDGNRLGCLALKKIHKSERYGAVILSEDQTISQFLEKKMMEEALINAGVYYLKKEIIQHIGTGNVSLESEVFPQLCQKKQLSGVPMEGHFIDIGIPADYARACEKLPLWSRTKEDKG